MKLIWVAIFFLSLGAQAKQAIICKKAEKFDDTMEQLNGLMIEPTWPMDISYVRDTGAKTKVSANPKDFKFDISNVRYFETKEKITEGKKTRDATFYNACIPITFN